MDNKSKIRELPKAPFLKQLIGPSFILLGLGLGSGEVVLWPNLTSLYGLGIIWAAIIGIVFQYFLNIEIERYTLVTGESIFVGLGKKYPKVSPLWFILSTFIPWVWPGIILSSGFLLASAINIPNANISISLALLLLIGVIFTFGKTIYKVQEKTQKILIFLGIPFILFLAIYFSTSDSVIALVKGVVGVGNGYQFFPKGLSLASFLAAMAYAGAGGNLNLAQSYYVKEKGYGMGQFTDKLPGIFSKNKVYSLESFQFEETDINKNNFYDWWKKINLEHIIVFLFTGVVTIVALSYLAYISSYPAVANNGIKFLLAEASFISSHINVATGKLFLILLSLMLFGTQFGVFGSTSRIISENIFLFTKNKNAENISKYFIFAVWGQVIAGVLIILFGFAEPLTLVILSAILNAFSMAVYTILLLILNMDLKPSFVKISNFRKAVLLVAFLVYSSLLVVTLVDRF